MPDHHTGHVMIRRHRRDEIKRANKESHCCGVSLISKADDTWEAARRGRGTWLTAPFSVPNQHNGQPLGCLRERVPESAATRAHHCCTAISTVSCSQRSGQPNLCGHTHIVRAYLDHRLIGLTSANDQFRGIEQAGIPGHAGDPWRMDRLFFLRSAHETNRQHLHICDNGLARAYPS